MKLIVTRLLLLLAAIYLGCIAAGPLFSAIHHPGQLSPAAFRDFSPLGAIATLGMAIMLIPHMPATAVLVLALATSILYIWRSWPNWFWLLPFACSIALGLSIREAWRVD